MELSAACSCSWRYLALHDTDVAVPRQESAELQALSSNGRALVPASSSEPGEETADGAETSSGFEVRKLTELGRDIRSDDAGAREEAEEGVKRRKFKAGAAD